MTHAETKLDSTVVGGKRRIENEMVPCTAWKVSVFGVILVHIFPHPDWIRENADQNNSEYLFFLPNVDLWDWYGLILF